MKLSLKNIELKLGDNDFIYNLEINSSIVGIYGESGAGKSTLLNLISGLESAQNGSISINNKILFDSKNKINIKANKRKIAYVFQEDYLFPHLTVRENLLFSEPYIEKEKINFSDIVQLLDLNSLLDKKPISLSGGEKQRVSIGRALLSQADLLLFDEPFSSLDHKRRKQIIIYLLKINNIYQLPMLIVSHDLSDILKLTQDFILIENRRIKACGNYISLSENKANGDIIKLDNYINVIETKFSSNSTMSIFEIQNDKKRIITLSRNQYTDKLKEGEIVKLSVRPNDIIISLTMPKDTSVQNCIKGIVTGIINKEDACFIKIDCGVSLLVDISISSLVNLEIKEGKELFCLIKARAIEYIY